MVGIDVLAWPGFSNHIGDGRASSFVALIHHKANMNSSSYLESE